MIRRNLEQKLGDTLAEFPAVALLGPRQVGKTTLALSLAQSRPSVYLDLESQSDLNKLSDPLSYFKLHENKLIILDEVQRIPNIFQTLRGVIDEGKRCGLDNCRFLLLGSASIELIKQSGESLAGRIAYLELSGLSLNEVGENHTNTLWLRGGFPDSYLATSESQSILWRQNFIRTYLERDIPSLGPRIPAETLRRFWTMLSHNQGQLLNAAALARGLAVDGKTISRYLDLLHDLLLIRKLQPWHSNNGKRLTKPPKIFVRDSGIAHNLLGISDFESLLSHPINGASWEGFVIENIMAMTQPYAQAYFYRTAAGAEIDFLLILPSGEKWAIEIKRSSSPKLERGFYFALNDFKPNRSFVVYPGNDSYPIGENIEVIGLAKFLTLLKDK